MSKPIALAVPERLAPSIKSAILLEDDISCCPLESVSKLDQGLQSFRSMRRMEASFRNARALRLRFSQSLARRRQRLSQAMGRSTIQRLGSGANPLAWSDRLTISVLRQGRTSASALVKIGP